MIKALSHSIMIAAVLLSQLYSSFVVAGYQLNYEHYAQELCENQERPELHCEGKCMLTKQLAVHEESKTQGEAPVLLPGLLLFSQSFPDPDLRPVLSSESIAPFARASALPPTPFHTGIDHPPQV